jgi:hypothetical protein
MQIAMILRLLRAVAPVVAIAAAWPAHAQQSPNCARLESQLSAFDRSAADPSRAEQVRRFEDAAGKQQAEIDRQQAVARRTGCGQNNFFVLFSGEPPQCGPINVKIRQMQANLDGIHADLERLQSGSGPERDSQRRAILVALAQNNCGQQYRAAVVASPPPRSGGLFESLFGPGTIFSPGGDAPGWSSPGGTYRTVCVRTCDGFYFPISFATNSSQFAEDEKACQRSCPAAEVMLFSYRNPGEDVSQAVSIGGQLYSTLPNAFRYRQAFDSSCSCKRPGETWAQALKNVDDTTVERGDIVVNQERARLLSQPRVDAQGRPIKPDPNAARANPTAAGTTAAGSNPAAAPPPAAMVESKPNAAATKPDPKRQIRSVGPTFIPAR